MKKNSSKQTAQARRSPAMVQNSTIGLDVSDKYTYAAVLNQQGELIEEARMQTSQEALQRWLKQWPVSRVALETGTHSRWMARAVSELGHQVLVANARQLRLIYGGHTKTDRLDARKLARLARLDPELLGAIEHRSEKEQGDLALIVARDALVQMRTQAINLVRGMVKSAGRRVVKCAAESFTQHANAVVPDTLRNALALMLEQIDELNQRIRDYDERIEQVRRTEYPETERMMQVQGVGAVTALTFRLKIGRGERFERSRDVGSYLGMRPKKDASGEQDKQLGITKAGDPLLRRLLVNCAQYILGRFGPETDLRRWGLRLAGNGKGKGKKRAVVAVARKLAVLLHRLLVSGERYEPLRQAGVGGHALAAA